MKKMEDDQKINLFYFDESGFTTTSSVPYAWQPKGQTLEIPCFHSKRLNILGFMGRNNAFYFHVVEGGVKTKEVVAAFDAFTGRYAVEYATHKKPCIIILDNASTHTSAAFLAKKDEWLACGVALHYLPTYSPELNLIEILWRQVKYQWLPLSCYLSYENLKQSVLNVLSGFGNEYLLTFD
jgi:transposase